jgi:thiol-disulfide isomerase/thioredoxin
MVEIGQKVRFIVQNLIKDNLQQPMNLLKKFLVPAIVIIGGLSLYYYYKVPKYSGSELSPDFTAKDLTGMSYHHYARSSNEEIVLLSFWGSWCGPCRQKNPEVVRISELSKSFTKFSVISIPVEKSEAQMMKAIQDDGLQNIRHLPQMSYFKSEVPVKYGVRDVPTSYLIDQNNRIIAVNPSLSEVETLLKSN